MRLSSDKTTKATSLPTGTKGNIKTLGNLTISIKSPTTTITLSKSTTTTITLNKHPHIETNKLFSKASTSPPKITNSLNSNSSINNMTNRYNSLTPVKISPSNSNTKTPPKAMSKTITYIEIKTHNKPYSTNNNKWTLSLHNKNNS